MEEMSKSSLTTSKRKKMRRSSESSSSTPPMSFSSLPYDVALNCLARTSRIHHPTLSLVSKTFQSLLASPELYGTRSRIGKTENFLYVCLNLNKKNPNPSWFILSPIPEQQELIPIPSFPYQHSPCSTVISIGSEIYIIGGRVNRNISRRVLILDCRSHQWRQLPDMRVARKEAAADVIDGKIHVTGGRKSKNSKNWGEVYDSKTQTWEPISPTTLDLTVQKSVYPSRLVMDGKIYNMDGLKRYDNGNRCLVEIETELCEIWILSRCLNWRYAKAKSLLMKKVKGLEGLPKFSNDRPVVISRDVTRRVKVWWTSVKDRCHGCHRRRTGECKTEIWCAEVSFKRRSREELWGFVEWSKNVLTLPGCDSLPGFFMHSAMVTH